MNEEVATRRRTPSPGVVAFRNERKLLLPVRQQIDKLQKRVAFIDARARSGRGHDPEAARVEFGEVRQSVGEAQRQIEALMDGQLGVGPATDCRKALQTIIDRLPV